MYECVCCNCAAIPATHIASLSIVIFLRMQNQTKDPVSDAHLRQSEWNVAEGVFHDVALHARHEISVARQLHFAPAPLLQAASSPDDEQAHQAGNSFSDDEKGLKSSAIFPRSLSVHNFLHRWVRIRMKGKGRTSHLARHSEGHCVKGYYCRALLTRKLTNKMARSA